ncbi:MULTISPECIES: L,D-transpeptidase [Anaerosinus]|uniref:L,D-transpeptidase n=1 Tax=Selenobaculum gibii TaxID=3054208 RepID=A0A9Y2AGY9_9FIRM|nr:L,D-transpeptidase [Selenobaculum gbiensis]WIW69758.1 L,D-transpeptidase [Selenobaculum gbiensis]
MLKSFGLILAMSFMVISIMILPVAAAEITNPSIVVNIPSRTLTIFADGKAIKVYNVGIGTKENKTPIGDFNVKAKEKNPIWIKPFQENVNSLKDNKEELVIIESGPDNPLGYRWIEFDGVYGIHGTNKPESIGGYVSNGCVRMVEADVEDLYEKVQIGTPVKITYQRLIICEGLDGNVSLKIYPDEYGCQTITMDGINKQLTRYGLNGFVDNDKLYEALAYSNGEPMVLGKSFSILVNGKKIDKRGVLQNGIYYLPVIPIAIEQKTNVEWNPDTQNLTSYYGNARGFVRDNILYINKDDVHTLYGLYANWDAGRNMMRIESCNEQF